MLYNGAQALLAGGVSALTLRLVLLASGPTTFDATDDDVTEILAHARNTETGGISRIPLVGQEISVDGLGIKRVIIRVTDVNLYGPPVKAAGAGLIYSFVTNDASSPPIALLRSGDLTKLVDGSGYDISFLAAIFDASGVTAGSYGATNLATIITVDTAGRVTAASTVADS